MEYLIHFFNPFKQQRAQHEFIARDEQELNQLIDMWLEQNPGWMRDRLTHI